MSDATDDMDDRPYRAKLQQPWPGEPGYRKPQATQPDDWLDKQLDHILFEYRLDVDRFSYGAELLIAKATAKAKAAILQHLAAAERAADIAGRIDELKETVIAQDTYAEDRSYGRGAFHHVPVKEVEERIAELQPQQPERESK